MVRPPGSRSSAARSAAPSMVSTTRRPADAPPRPGSGGPRSTLLPSSRTTSGLVAASPQDRRARCTMPLATASQDGDAAEDVDEHAAHVRVGQDDVEAVGHHLGRGAAADVEEVGRLDAAVLLAGVGDDVQGRHDQARAVADDADLAVELDVVEVLLLGLLLERVGRGDVDERRVAGLAEVGVVVEGHLAVEGEDRCRRRRSESASGLTSTSVASASTNVCPQADQDRGDLLGDLGREAAGGRRSRAPWPSSTPAMASTGTRASASGRSTASCSISMPPSRTPSPGRCGWPGRAGRRRSTPGLMSAPGSTSTRWTVWPLMSMPRIASAAAFGVGRRLGDLHAAGLAAAADLHLRLDDGHAADATPRLPRPRRGIGDLAEADRHAVRGEELLGLVLEQIHAAAPFCDGFDRGLRRRA